MFQLIGALLSLIFYGFVALFNIKIIRVFLIIALTIFIPLFFVRCNSPDLYDNITASSVSALNSTTLYNHSKEVYLDSIITGGNNITYYKLKTDIPYYSSILSDNKLQNTEPSGIIPKNTITEFGYITKKTENVWIQVFFYEGNNHRFVYALFPKDWEEYADSFDMEEKIKEINARYEEYVLDNFKLTPVNPDEEAVFKETNKDFFKVKGINGDTYYYVEKKDRSNLNRVYEYFLTKNNINMTVLQADNEWARQELSTGEINEEEK